MVKPVLISASNRPVASPLNSCDKNNDMLGIQAPPFIYMPVNTLDVLDVSTQLAAEHAQFRQCRLAVDNFDDVEIVVGVLHVGRLLAAHDGEVDDALVVARTERDITHWALANFAGFIGFDDRSEEHTSELQ